VAAERFHGIGDRFAPLIGLSYVEKDAPRLGTELGDLGCPLCIEYVTNADNLLPISGPDGLVHQGAAIVAMNSSKGNSGRLRISPSTALSR
jgi:hypothetical protein